MTKTQRKSKRIRVALPVRVTLFDEEHAATKEMEGKLQDLSVGGCSIHAQQEIPIGDRVQVQIELDEHYANKFHQQQLTARGAVIRSLRKDSGILISIRFTKP